MNPPADLAALPDAVPRWEPLHRFANRPYSALGRDYVPATELRPYRERGTASWYGRKFHNQRTSTGEPYDMYAMTAAHPTLPLPSYARVTNLQNGRSVIVRVNDRGPFLHGRVIDLSYAAAFRLGYAGAGSAQVEVETVFPEAPGVFAAAALGGRAAGAAAPLPAPAPATAPTPTAIADPELPLRAEGADFWLQLGAFIALENAENFMAVLEFQLSGVGNGAGEFSYAPRIRSRDNRFRIEVGPYPSREAARRAAADLANRYGIGAAPATR